MQAASAIFAERGVNGASVEEIAEAAGYTRGAFYSNFADKSELVLAMLNQKMSAQFAIAYSAIDAMKALDDRHPEELINRALTALERAGQPPRVAALLVQELKLHAAREADLHAAYLDFEAEATRRVDELIRDALDYLGLELTIPADHALRLIIAVHEHEQQRAVFVGGGVDNGPLRTLLLAITRPLGQPAGATGAAEG